jgi:hypothetical protein
VGTRTATVFSKDLAVAPIRLGNPRASCESASILADILTSSTPALVLLSCDVLVLLYHLHNNQMRVHLVRLNGLKPLNSSGGRTRLACICLKVCDIACHNCCCCLSLTFESHNFATVTIESVALCFGCAKVLQFPRSRVCLRV